MGSGQHLEDQRQLFEGLENQLDGDGIPLRRTNTYVPMIEEADEDEEETKQSYVDGHQVTFGKKQSEDDSPDKEDDEEQLSKDT